MLSPTTRVGTSVLRHRTTDIYSFVLAACDENRGSPARSLARSLTRHVDPIRSDELVFQDTQGDRIAVLSADYGFRSGSGRLYMDSYGAVPRSIVELSVSNFKKELMALRRSVRMDEFREISEASGNVGEMSFLRKTSYKLLSALREQLSKLDSYLEDENVLRKLDQPKNALSDKLSEEQLRLLDQVRQLQLDDAKVTQAEREREARDGRVEAPGIIRFTYNSLCWVLDVLYAGRPVQRFWVLETVARMPYFSYISMLHLYESLGWWRAGAEVRKVHFAEEWNELHHLQIMESLGGDQQWVDRFIAEHAAVFYYWVLVLMYAVSPSSSYALSELIEHHASDTYTVFAEQNKELLKTIPPPLVALNYYKSGDLYLFDQLQTEWVGQAPRRPDCNNLYDVFVNIRDDENEHVKTMHALKTNTLQVNGYSGAEGRIASLAEQSCWDEED